MIKYGLISEVDASCLEKTIDLICDEFKEDVIHVTEIGVYAGATGNGIIEYIKSKGLAYNLTGIENLKDNEELSFRYLYSKIIIGNSNEVYNQLEDESQDMIFFDGDHSKIGVISDFFAYADKIKVSGFACFHDTGRHIKPFKDFQHGDKENPDAYISVRKALNKIGLLPPFVSIIQEHHNRIKQYYGWELVFDEADENDEAGGICVFRKL